MYADDVLTFHSQVRIATVTALGILFPKFFDTQFPFEKTSSPEIFAELIDSPHAQFRSLSYSLVLNCILLMGDSVGTVRASAGHAMGDIICSGVLCRSRSNLATINLSRLELKVSSNRCLSEDEKELCRKVHASIISLLRDSKLTVLSD